MLIQAKAVSPPLFVNDSMRDSARYSAFTTAVPNAGESNPVRDSAGDIFVKNTQAASPAAPRFGGWGFLFKPTIKYGLPFATAGLGYMRDNVDRSIERDNQRREHRRYERKKHETWEKLGKPKKRWISRHRYEIVTPVTVKDGNGRTLSHYNRVEGPYRA